VLPETPSTEITTQENCMPATWSPIIGASALVFVSNEQTLLPSTAQEGFVALLFGKTNGQGWSFCRQKLTWWPQSLTDVNSNTDRGTTSNSSKCMHSYPIDRKSMLMYIYDVLMDNCLERHISVVEIFLVQDVDRYYNISEHKRIRFSL
jgi:hypothetical protein